MNMDKCCLGQSVDRVDGKLKVTGRALYSADQSIPNICYGYLLQSSIAKGKIQSMDVTAAQGNPGVLAIFTPFNRLRIFAPGDEGFNSGDALPLLQDTAVDYFGQTIGLVVGETFEQARDAARLVKTEYQAQPAVVDLEAGLGNAYAPKSVGGMGGTVSFLADGEPRIDDAFRGRRISD